MADVALAAGRLVGDDRERVGLGAGAGGRRDGDDRAARASASGPSYPSSQTGSVVRGAQVERLGRVHRRAAADRHDDRAVSPKSRSAAAPRSTVEAPGFGSTSAKTAVSRPAAASTPSTRSMTPDPTDARVGHHEDPRATGRGDHLGESLDRADPEQDPVAQDDLDLPIGQRASRDLDDGVGRRVAADRQPAPAAGRVEPALGRRRRRGSRRPRPRRSRARRGR